MVCLIILKKRRSNLLKNVTPSNNCDTAITDDTTANTDTEAMTTKEYHLEVILLCLGL